VNQLGVVVTMQPTKGPDSYGYGSYTYGSTHTLEQAPTELTAAQAKPKRVRRTRTKVGA
jgi:hypothetical protein